jgi:hypothetical protein
LAVIVKFPIDLAFRFLLVVFVLLLDKLINGLLKTGSAIFEIKSITPDNERSQCRHALSQLYEYRYLHSLPDASLWLVLSRPPQSTWLVDYLMNDRGVEVLWVADERLDGPSIARLDA